METRFVRFEKIWRLPSWFWTATTIAVIGATAGFAPVERTLGSNLRIILLHGAWVWTGLILFGLAAFSGLVGLLGYLFGIEKVIRAGTWSQPLGWAALFFWLTYLPLSMWVMKTTWGGFFFDEPRWRIPFTFAVVAMLLQAGLALMGRPAITRMGNLLFGAALWIELPGSPAVLHPESPVAQSGSTSIQATFAVLLALALFLGLQLTRILLPFSNENRKP